MTKRVLAVCSNSWEREILPSAAFMAEGRFEIVYHGPDAEGSPGTFDALGFVEATVAAFRGRGIDGVASSSDYPGCLVAAAIAHELGLPGPEPAALLRCSHKYRARQLQRAAVPEATPPFALVDPMAEDCGVGGLSFPLFVKPVKSWFSVFARRVDSLDELRTFATLPAVGAFLRDFVRPFDALARRYGDLELGAGHLLAEGLLAGTQVTVEGYVWAGRAEVIGITDSIMHPGTISFARFDHPSALPEAVQARMAEIVRRAVGATGLDNSLFNVELFYDPARDAIAIVEINPRMAGQFADLMEKVHGTNTFEIMLDLAVGDRPRVRRGGGRDRVAASFPLRAFADRRVARLPDAAQIAAVRERFPGLVVKLDYREGQRLSDAGSDQNDWESYRYAVVNLGARDWPTLLRARDEAVAALDVRLDDP